MFPFRVHFHISPGWAACLFAALALALALPAPAQDAAPPTWESGPAIIAPDLPDEGPVRADLDTYGGWTGLKGQATGFFHVEPLGGRTWLITPEGNAFFMLEMGWTKPEHTPRLRSWGFNTSETGTGMPYTVHLRFFRQTDKSMPISERPGYPPWVTFPDVFDPAWPQKCQEHAQQVLGPHANDPYMIGYYMDNEICLDGWYDAVTRAAADAPCRAAFIEVARAYYADKPDGLARDWQPYGITRVEDLAGVQGAPPNVSGLRTAWEAAVAERAFSVPASAAKAVDPHHLNLGTRLINAPLPAPAILAAMGKYCDVISLNLYNMLPDRLLTQIFTLVPALNAMTGRPTLTSEFSFRGGDTRHPNTMGAMPTVKTQAERAIGYLSYVAALASIPGHVGVSWYKYPDDALEVRWEGYAEDCNFGVVDPQNRPYAVLTEGMRATNSMIYELAADPVRNEACPLFWRTELLRWDRPYDELLLQRLMRSKQPFVDPLAAALPEPRRYDQNYWIRHRSPGLTINDERFCGWCEANVIRERPESTTLILFNVQYFTSFPRSLWLGRECPEPGAPLALESNAQYLLRRIDAKGRLLRLTIADGSYTRPDGVMEVRADRRAAYLDLRFDPGARTLAITARGGPNRLGVADVEGWQATWNGKPLAAAQISKLESMTVYTPAP